MNDILKLTVTELSGKLASRELSGAEITGAYLDRIAEKEPEIGAYLTVSADEAMDNAKRSTSAARRVRSCLPSPVFRSE